MQASDDSKRHCLFLQAPRVADVGRALLCRDVNRAANRAGGGDAAANVAHQAGAEAAQQHLGLAAAAAALIGEPLVCTAAVLPGGVHHQRITPAPMG